MCNLSQGIVDETRDETRAEIIMNMFKKGYTMEQIADVTDKSVAEIEEIVKKESVLAQEVWGLIYKCRLMQILRVEMVLSIQIPHMTIGCGFQYEIKMVNGSTLTMDFN